MAIPKGGQTGAGAHEDPAAEAAYERIRADDGDVAQIAAAMGLKPANVQRVKDHTFGQVHLLDRFVSHGVAATMGRFQASPDIAAAWARLAAGQGRPNDLQLLRHETAEAWYMRRHGPSYDAAHKAADARYRWREE